VFIGANLTGSDFTGANTAGINLDSTTICPDGSHATYNGYLGSASRYECRF
jgi:uncharacterized protein YjbI with pentapeptide repeats